jgi:hypothetical protein
MATIVAASNGYETKPGENGVQVEGSAEGEEKKEGESEPEEEKELTFEEAKARAAARAEAALQCSIDNKEACMMCSG